MSTASGNASKGEKGKKFQSLKINLCAANKPTEPEQQQQHRSNIQRKQHGMTSLGRVPTARRPTNLPSEKAEHGGNDISVNLVPSGGPGWGNKPNESGSTTTPPLSANPPTSVSVNNVTTTGTSQQVPRAQLYQPTSRMAPVPASMGGHAPVHHSHTDVKTWAMMTHGGDTLAPNFLTPQSPLFQHEFPSLSSNSETSSAATPVTAIATQKHTANTTVDTQYGPGPSLRPQTEGSWIQGGSCPQNSMSHAAGSQPVTAPAQGRPMSAFPPPAAPDGARNNLGPSGVGAAQAGPNYSSNVPQLPPHFTGMMPQFMLRNNNFVPNFAALGPMKGPPASRPSQYSSFSGPHSSGDRFMPPGAHAHAGKRAYDEEDVKIRPIVKEEDLNQMANMGNDVGWAAHEDIDYNQKLKFSDDEDDDRNKDNRKTRTRTHFKISDKHLEKESDLRTSKESLKDREKSYSVEQRNPEMKNAWQMRRAIIPSAAPSTGRYQIPANGRFEEDDETWQERRRQKKEEMDIIIQRAKERKEEEEKRFNEQQQAATLKLKKLEAAMEANQYGNKENRIPTGSELDMLPPWEKEKYQSVIAANDDSRKSNVPAPVPVVKDASEFRELTQLVDKNFVKKDVKERESVQPTGFSRAFVAPRFQHRQTNAPSGPTRSIISHSTQFTSKTNFNITRLQRSESDSLSDKDRDWKTEDGRKERDADRYSKDSFKERDYSHNHGHEQNNDTEYENKFGKEYEMRSKYYGDKEESSNDSYGGNFDCESLHASKTERRISESEKSKGYDVRRYSESENHEKDERGRSYDELEKLRHYGSATSRPPYPLYPEGDAQERKRSREETIYETSKNVDSYKKREKDVETLAHYKKEEGKRDMESFKDERKTFSAYDDRLSRNDHYRRESKESLRDETFNIQDTRYLWTDDVEADEKKLRKDIFREDRGDRYSHGQRHVPRPITRAKLEAKELESDSKVANLTPLVRSDKKIESKKNESEDNAKDKDSRLEKSGSSKTDPAEQPESQAGVPSAWKRDDSKKLKDESNATATSAGAAGYDANKVDDSKDDKNKETTTAAKKDDNAEKIAEDKAAKERRKADARIKDQRNWTRFEGSYQGGSSYGGGRNAALKSRRPNRTTATTTTSKAGSRRDPKYSESEYSDEVSGSGREDRNMRSDRDKNGRPLKSSSSKPRYDRDDRNDYRMDDRDYGNGRGGGGGGGGGRNNRDYYYKSAPRGRNSGFRQSAVGSGGGGKRMDGYGPPSTRTPFGGAASDDKPRSKPSKDASNAAEQNVTEKKGVESKTNKPVDRSWKKNVEAQADNKSLSSSASAQAIEANEESFATASEGSDSEDGVCEVSKNKSSSYGTTKRSPAVVVTKPLRKFRSTSRKRYDNRRTGAGTGAGASSSSSSYARKDSGSYGNIGSGKRNPPSNNSKPLTKKDGEKYDDGAAVSSVGDDAKASDKQTRDYPTGSQNKKAAKPRTNANPLKTSSSARPAAGAAASGRKNSDVPPRMQTKAKADDKAADPEYKYVRDGTWPTGSAWDKPLHYASTKRTLPVQRPVGSGANVTTAVIGQEKSLNQAGDHRAAETAASYPDQSASSAPTEKVTTKVLENLDGSTPPVQTIIFENTNYKSGPVDLSAKAKLGSGSHPFEKDSKLECSESGVPTYGNEPSGPELQSSKQHESLQMTLFNKNEDVNDMKLDFNYDSTEFSKLTDDSGKSSKATMELSHAMNMVQAPAEFKIPASVKKVWDGSADQYDDNKYDGGIANTSTSFSPSFSSHASDPNNGHIYSHVDASGHVQVDDVGGLGHGEVVFNPQLQGVNYGSSNCQAVMIKNDSSGSSSNVCKVKPQPQGCGTNIVNAAQSSVISTTLVSQPPPMSSPSYSFGCSTPQPNLSNGNVAFPQLNFPGYNVSPMPSSPVLFNSSQTASQTPAAAMYPAFQIDNSQVAARSQFGQFGTAFSLSNAALGQTATPYNQAQSLYLPPPTAPPPELYQQQVPQYRLQPQPFGNTQQITSPNTVLISSTTNNSLMSPSIKPATQQISAIGTKAAGFTAAQTSPQVYMAYDATTQLLAANQSYIPSNQLMQRPGNNVVAAGTLSAASNSYYSSATGAGQTGFYPGTNSALQQQTGAAIGLTAFTQSTNQSLNQIQSYGSQLTQQYRSAPQSYMKGSGNAAAMAADFGSNKAMTISNHDVLTPGFPPANKRIQPGNKNLQGVPQGIGQHAMSQNAYSYQASNPMRNNGNASKGSQYPHPIQRPVNPGNNSNRANGGGNNSGNSSAAHRMPVRNNSHQLVNNIQQPPSSAYYSTSSAYSTSKLDASQLDSKNESNADVKLADSMKTMSAKSASTDKNSAASNE